MNPQNPKKEKNLHSQERIELERLRELLNNASDPESLPQADEVERLLLQKIADADNPDYVSRYLGELQQYRQSAGAPEQKKSRTAEKQIPHLTRKVLDLAEEVEEIRKELGQHKKQPGTGHPVAFFFAFLFFLIGFICLLRDPYYSIQYIMIFVFFAASVGCLLIGLGPGLLQQNNDRESPGKRRSR